MPKMIINRGNVKRKRKEDRTLFLEESPKRMKVHAQRKFAQGSNVNSPVITPVEELERPEGSGLSIIPDPTELLPTKRPNTEDFLTFLCFRGTPLLPPTLNFFNTASFVDTNGQVHEIKSESPKNGPIDTSIIAKTGCGSADRPFIAFGVRKRADPVVISRQMDRKRRHALALQALRRKYQEQKMAKIRAVTISKLSEKITNRTLVRTNSVLKTDSLTKKSTVQKTKVIATKHVKVTKTVKTTLRPKIQPKMCLRSFRGRFKQRELPFRNQNIRKGKPVPVRRIIKKVEEKKILIKKNRRSLSSEFSSDDNEPLAAATSKEVKRSPKVIISKIDHIKQLQISSKETPDKTGNHATRSKQSKDTNFEQKRQQVKRRIFIPSPNPIVKIRNLRSQTILKSSPNAKTKRVLLVNETLNTVKNPQPKRKFIPKANPKVKKPANSSDRVLRGPQSVNKRIERTTKRITKREETITNIGRPKVISNVKKLEKKIIKPTDTISKKSDKTKDKTPDDLENTHQDEKQEKHIKRPDSKICEQNDKKEKDVTGKITKETTNKDKKPAEKIGSRKEKLPEKSQTKLESKSRKPELQGKVTKKNKANPVQEKEPTSESESQCKMTQKKVSNKANPVKDKELSSESESESGKVVQKNLSNKTNPPKEKKPTSKSELQGKAAQKNVGNKTNPVQEKEPTSKSESQGKATQKNVSNKTKQEKEPTSKSESQGKVAQKNVSNKTNPAQEKDPTSKAESQGKVTQKNVSNKNNPVQEKDPTSKPELQGKVTQKNVSNKTNPAQEKDPTNKSESHGKLAQKNVSNKNNPAQEKESTSKSESQGKVSQKNVSNKSNPAQENDPTSKPESQGKVIQKNVSNKNNPAQEKEPTSKSESQGKVTQKNVSNKTDPLQEKAPTSKPKTQGQETQKNVSNKTNPVQEKEPISKSESQSKVTQKILDNKTNPVQEKGPTYTSELQGKVTQKNVNNKTNPVQEKEPTKESCTEKIETDINTSDKAVKNINKKVVRSKVEKEEAAGTNLEDTSKIIDENIKDREIINKKPVSNPTKEPDEEKTTKESIKKEKENPSKKDIQQGDSSQVSIKKKEVLEEKPEIANKGTLKELASDKAETSKITENVPNKPDKRDIKEKVTPKVAEKNTKKVVKKNVSKTIGSKDIQKKELSEPAEKIEEEQKPCSSRPSRKTKEAAAIYMEILSHKLVNDKKDDDNVSIDSFPELPNVKKMEQRENEFRAMTTQKLVDETVPKSLKMKEPKQKNITSEAKVASRDTLENMPKAKCIPHRADNEKTSKKDKYEDQNNEKSTNDHKQSQDKSKTTKQKELKVLVGNVDDKSKTGLKSSGNGTKKKTVASKLTDFDEEKVKEEIMREVQKKLGTNISLNTSRSEEKEVEVFKTKEIPPKRKSSFSDDEDLQSIRKKLKSQGETQKPSKDNDNDIPVKDALKTKPVLEEKEPETKQEKAEISISNQNKEKDNIPSNLETNTKKPEIIKNKDVKDDSKKIEKEINPAKNSDDNPKRQTRHGNPRNRENDDSDESFHADVTITKKRQVTRHKPPKLYKSFSESEESLLWDKNETTQKFLNSASLGKSISSGESDHSTTSDRVKKPDSPTNKIKRYTKTKSKAKEDANFSDSDEEPLVKLTQTKPPQKDEDKQALPVDDKIKDEDTNVSEKIKVETTTMKNVKPTKGTKAKTASQTEVTVEEDTKKSVKPKRECAKRPQNYLPMFSSSDDDDKFFYGFDIDSNKDATFKPTLTAALPTAVDLSSKDIGRRFGKGKVNMSNEQIEQWLKDSVLAASSLKKENDEMLKFGEKIPTETSLELASSIDTQKLKESLSLLTSEDKKEETKVESKPKQTTPAPKLLSPSSDKVIKLSFTSSKNQSLDKKLIFRKEKKNTTPNANAFSANNESSVYAFGEENEDLISTPFRRPVRRPSSTATSKSEEEGKNEDTIKLGQFRRPPLLKQDTKIIAKDPVNEDTTSQENTVTSEDILNIDSSSEVDTNKSANKQEFRISEERSLYSMVPPSNPKSKPSDYKLLKLASRSFDRTSETSEEGKYKIPSSPSASSSSSAKLYKRQGGKPKARGHVEVCTPLTVPSFPSGAYTPMLVEAPTFYPVDKEFQDPLEYIEKIRHKAEEFGICRIIPPSSFKPECKVTDDMRFTAYNQYVHKMLHRWGPNFKEFMAIKKYLQTQNITLVHSPWIGGMEIDLPRLYQTVQSLGGLKEVIEKKKWPRVSELMRIPKSAQDRVTKLDDIYCKYLLPYDTLSPDEREKLFDEVETEWATRESKTLQELQQNTSNQANTNDSENESDHETEECIVKGRGLALNAFYRIARNTMSVWFKNPEPPAQEVEQEFWRHVMQRQHHICVHSGSIDSGSWGYGFAVSKNSPFARNAWNLKVLTNNSGSVLRSLGPMMGVTVPTLHVGMVFSACCWYRDPHSLPWIEYLHTGGNKIWYSIPDSASELFHTAMKKLVPNYCKNKTIWLASDTAMVPPSVLIENGVSLCRTVQQPGQFVVVFPKAFTSSISTGYVVSESVYFAPPYWLKLAQKVFSDMRSSCESSMFSLNRLLMSIANDSRSNTDVLRQILPLVKDMCDKEKADRDKLKELGLSATEKLPPPENPNARKRKKLHGEDGDYECDICRMNLFISMVVDIQDNGLYCIEHAIEFVQNGKIPIANCKLIYTYDEEELTGLNDKINTTIESKMQKKVLSKFHGMPTLLKS